LPAAAWREVRCTMTIVGGHIVHGGPDAVSS